MKRCYYEILEVDRKATQDQIKKAYRKMAIKLHPDKNPSEEAKKQFMQCQQAYEVISDPNERTFYDNNREKILFNKDDMSKEDLQEYSFGFNIWPYFSAKCFKGFGDEEGGFFEVYRDIFEKIKAEEIKAYKIREEDLDQDLRKYEGFGVSDTSEEKVKRFYEDWDNFTTYKSFVWIEEYDLREAENRWVKRQMEKQNKKERLKQKKNYIKTIKDLVSFVKKRDPRYQQMLLKQAEKQAQRQKQRLQKIEEKKRQKGKGGKSKQQAEEERFRQIEAYHEAQKNGQTFDSEQQFEYESHQYSCLICKKAFQSANQLGNHQKSKAHRKLVREIERQVMLKEEAEEKARNLANENTKEQSQQEKQEKEQAEPVKAKKKRFRKKKNKNAEINEEPEQQKPQQVKEPEVVDLYAEQKAQKERRKREKAEMLAQMADSDDSDDMDAFMGLVKPGKKGPEVQKPKGQSSGNQQAKKGKKKTNRLLPVADSPSSQESEDSEQPEKPATQAIGKAKLKKMKKAEQQNLGSFICKVCAGHFTSNTKLFDHIKKTGHAAPKA